MSPKTRIHEEAPNHQVPRGVNAPSKVIERLESHLKNSIDFDFDFESLNGCCTYRKTIIYQDESVEIRNVSSKVGSNTIDLVIAQKKHFEVGKRRDVL